MPRYQGAREYDHHYYPLPGHDADDAATGNNSRNDPSTTTNNNNNAIALDPSVLGLPDDLLTASRLLRARPDHSGWLYKKKERCLGLCPCLRPLWQRRFFVISGRFLYRYASPESHVPKGAPLPLESLQVRVLGEEEGEEERAIVPFLFLISTLSKEMVVAAETEDARRTWVQQLNRAKQRAIKENLGHAAENKEHAVLNKMGSKLWLRRRSRAGGEGAAGGGGMIEMRTVGAAGGFVDPHY